jgi:hypothetical protein
MSDANQFLSWSEKELKTMRVLLYRLLRRNHEGYNPVLDCVVVVDTLNGIGRELGSRGL